MSHQIHEIEYKVKKSGVWKGVGFTAPESIISYLRKAVEWRPDQEKFIVLLLNAQNEPMGYDTSTLGLVNQSQVHPREAFRAAVGMAAVSVIFVHNHPSGSTKFSPEDIVITERLISAGKVLDISVMDHLLIVPSIGWASMRAQHPGLFN